MYDEDKEGQGNKLHKVSRKGGANWIVQYMAKRRETINEAGERRSFDIV
jgi:hypothetical protein